MDRTLITWNVPNLITVPLMAFLGFILAGLVWQLYLSASQNGGNLSAGAAGA